MSFWIIYYHYCVYFPCTMCLAFVSEAARALPSSERSVPVMRPALGSITVKSPRNVQHNVCTCCALRCEGEMSGGSGLCKFGCLLSLLFWSLACNSYTVLLRVLIVPSSASAVQGAILVPPSCLPTVCLCSCTDTDACVHAWKPVSHFCNWLRPDPSLSFFIFFQTAKSKPNTLSRATRWISQPIRMGCLSGWDARLRWS